MPPPPHPTSTHPAFLSQGLLPGTVQPAHGCQHHGGEDRPGCLPRPSPSLELSQDWGLSGQDSAGRAQGGPGHSPDRQGFCSPSSRRSPGMAPSPFSEFQLRPRLPWNSSDDLFSLAPLTCALLVSLVYQSISLRLEPHTRCGHAVFFLFVFNLWPIFKKKKKISRKMEASSFSREMERPAVQGPHVTVASRGLVPPTVLQAFHALPRPQIWQWFWGPGLRTGAGGSERGGEHGLWEFIVWLAE